MSAKLQFCAYLIGASISKRLFALSSVHLIACSAAAIVANRANFSKVMFYTGFYAASAAISSATLAYCCYSALDMIIN